MTAFALEHHIADRAAKRQLEHFRRDIPLPEGEVAHPEPLMLDGGVPHNGFFPLDKVSLHLVDEPLQRNEGTNYKLGQFLDTPLGSTAEVLRYRPLPDVLDLDEGLQYAPVRGTSALLQFTRDVTERVHTPALADWDTILTAGAGNGLHKAVDLLLLAGETILVEEFTFTPFLNNVRAVGGIPVLVKLDFAGDGLDVEYLADLLANWSTHHPDKPKPKVLYLIPTGQNPLGLTQSVETRKKVYALLQEHDLVLIEDDPYGYLELPEYGQKEGYDVTAQEFIDRVAKLYLSIDTDGRVVRVETFLKVFGPGLRLGFIVAHKRFIEVIDAYLVLLTRAPPGPLQFLVSNTVKQLGGLDGWLEWLLKVRQAYLHRRDVVVKALYELDAYKQGLILVVVPQAGMFVLVVLNLPGVKPEDYPTVTKALMQDATISGVHIVLGTFMLFSPLAAPRSNFVRLTYAAVASDELLEEGIRRFSTAVELFNKRVLKA